jgi:NTE family protein
VAERTAKAGPGGRASVLVDLALQGGGAHGAFTWGVCDRLLEEDWLEVEGISGTSAGAMNAAVLASGFATGGRAGARTAMEAFWKRVSDAATFSPFQRGPMDRMLGNWTLDNSPGFLLMDLLARLVSPYDVPSFGPNPLEQILRDSVDFGAVARGPIKVFVTATNVRTGRPRIFRNADLGAEALLASACLPQLFQAVEIEGEPYWDGGFAGNPTLFPLVKELTSDDTILVPINPIERPGTPRAARDILDRVNEISFNSVALKELKMLALLRRVADPGSGEGAAWARMRMHVVRNEVMVGLGYSSKLNAEWPFLCMLRDEGRKAAEEFLATHGEAIGKRSSLDFDKLLEGI